MGKKKNSDYKLFYAVVAGLLVLVVLQILAQNRSEIKIVNAYNCPQTGVTKVFLSYDTKLTISENETIIRELNVEHGRGIAKYIYVFCGRPFNLTFCLNPECNITPKRNILPTQPEMCIRVRNSIVAITNQGENISC